MNAIGESERSNERFFEGIRDWLQNGAYRGIRNADKTVRFKCK